MPLKAGCRKKEVPLKISFTVLKEDGGRLPSCNFSGGIFPNVSLTLNPTSQDITQCCHSDLKSIFDLGGGTLSNVALTLNPTLIYL